MVVVRFDHHYTTPCPAVDAISERILAVLIIPGSPFVYITAEFPIRI